MTIRRDRMVVETREESGTTAVKVNLGWRCTGQIGGRKKESDRITQKDSLTKKKKKDCHGGAETIMDILQRLLWLPSSHVIDAVFHQHKCGLSGVYDV